GDRAEATCVTSANEVPGKCPIRGGSANRGIVIRCSGSRIPDDECIVRVARGKGKEISKQYRHVCARRRISVARAGEEITRPIVRKANPIPGDGVPSRTPRSGLSDNDFAG